MENSGPSGIQVDTLLRFMGQQKISKQNPRAAGPDQRYPAGTVLEGLGEDRVLLPTEANEANVLLCGVRGL